MLACETDVATTLHPTLFGDNLHCFKQLQNIGHLSTLHSPYIINQCYLVNINVPVCALRNLGEPSKTIGLGSPQNLDILAEGHS